MRVRFVPMFVSVADHPADDLPGFAAKVASDFEAAVNAGLNLYGIAARDVVQMLPLPLHNDQSFRWGIIVAAIDRGVSPEELAEVFPDKEARRGV